MKPRFTPSYAIVWALAALAYVAALSAYKNLALEQAARQGLQSIQPVHVQVLNLVQRGLDSNGESMIADAVRKDSPPSLERLRLINAQGNILFDSLGQTRGTRIEDPEILRTRDPRFFSAGFRVEILIPGDQASFLYTWNAKDLRTELFTALVAGLLAITGVFFVLWRWAPSIWTGLFMLRAKFVAAIALISIVTAAIIFVNLSLRQTREQTERIEKQSVIFARYTTGRLVQSFAKNFESSYYERFVPEVREIIASNEDLVRIRVVSPKTQNVLFDSEQGRVIQGIQKAEYTSEIDHQLQSQDLATRRTDRAGQSFFEVLSAFRAEGASGGPPVFLVEYLYSYGSLNRTLQAIRWDTFLGLILSVAIGLLIALVFAQLLISPIRKLVVALGKVTSGDYGVSVEASSRDEVGDLVRAFNIMTQELRRKKELRKYLSNSTYEQIVRASDRGDGKKLGGQRVQATILFSDIRDFVRHCESLEAEEVTSMLNEYFSEMVEVIHKAGGEVDKFIGDAILAVFYAEDDSRVIRAAQESGLPSSSSSALSAIYCALEMRERLALFNAKRAAVGKNTLEIGIGINHGEIISGPIGSDDRMDFTVIGDVVNLANRIEKLSKGGKHTRVVFSNQVEEKVRGLLDYEFLTDEPIRGKSESVQVFELIGIKKLDILTENLTSRDPALRRRSVELLGQSGNREAMPIVLSLLADSDEILRVNAVSAIGKLAQADDRGVTDALLLRLREEKSLKVLSALISCLGKVCRNERIRVLEPFLKHPDERIVANAVEALGQTRSSTGTDLILPLLNHRNNRIKANAAMALFAAGHVEVIDTLKPMLMHSDPLMRSSAAFAIGELTLIADLRSLVNGFREEAARMRFYLAELQDCVPMLVALLRDPDPMVKRQAVIALGKIKDKSAVLPMIEMIDLGATDVHDPSKDEFSRDILEALRAIGSHKLVREALSKLS